MTDKMALMHLMNVVDGEDTKWVLVCWICPKDSEDENYAEFETIFFFLLFLYVSVKKIIYTSRSFWAYLGHIPLGKFFRKTHNPEKFASHFRSFLDVLKTIEVLLLDFSENRTKQNNPVKVILFEISAH